MSKTEHHMFYLAAAEDSFQPKRASVCHVAVLSLILVLSQLNAWSRYSAYSAGNSRLISIFFRLSSYSLIQNVNNFPNVCVIVHFDIVGGSLWINVTENTQLL